MLVSASSDGSSVTVTFNEALDPTTVTAAAFTVAPGASVASASGNGTTATLVLFNQNGTEWQRWQPEQDEFSDVFTFPSQFGNGQAPIPAVGAAVYREDTNQVYLFNREGTRYTIWNGTSFTAAFDVEDLGDIEF